MFERFTDRARMVVVRAQAEARMLGHNYIGTEHLLLGLVQDDEGVGARALTSLGITPELFRQQVEEVVGRGDTHVTGHIPFTPRAKKVLELALRESIPMGHDYIGTEHILLGLVQEGEGVGAQVLKRLGVSLEPTRATVLRILEGGEVTPSVVARESPTELIERLTARYHLEKDALEQAQRTLGLHLPEGSQGMISVASLAGIFGLDVVALARFVKENMTG